MQTIKIDIINDKVLNLLKDLELLKLIRLRKENSIDTNSGTDWSKYKGAMSKQSIDSVDSQLNNLRGDWE